MKMKLFSADLDWKAETVVNEWLAEQPSSLAIHHSETRHQVKTSFSGAQVPMVTVTLWYSMPADQNADMRDSTPAPPSVDFA